MFQNVWRPTDKIVGGENLVRSLDLPRKDLLRGILLRTTAVVNITTLGTPALKSHAPSQYIQRIELIADGKDTIKSIPMRALVLKNFFNYCTYPRRTVPTLATGNNTFYQTVLLTAQMPRAIREIDTLINTGRLSTFILQLTFGSKDAIFSTAPTAYTLSSIEVQPHLNEAINIDVPQEKLNFSAYKELTIEKEVTQSTTEFQILLPVGNLYRGFMIETLVNDEPNDSVINSVQIRSGTRVFFKSQWLSLREQNALMMNMETQNFVGYGYIDFAQEGRLVDALDTSRLSQLEAIFDVTKQTGTNIIRVYPDEVIVPTLIKR